VKQRCIVNGGKQALNILFSGKKNGIDTTADLGEETSSSSQAVVSLSALLALPLSKRLTDFDTTSHSTPIGAVLLGRGERRKKRVSIDGRVQCRLTISRHDMSPEECNATWYSQEEYTEITESCCKQINKLNRGELLKGKKYCARGLEAHTNTRSLAKSMNRSSAYQAVLNEQDRQMKDGILQEEALARVYHAASSSSQLWANVVGLEDQREADNIYNDYSNEELLPLSSLRLNQAS